MPKKAQKSPTEAIFRGGFFRSYQLPLSIHFLYFTIPFSRYSTRLQRTF